MTHPLVNEAIILTWAAILAAVLSLLLGSRRSLRTPFVAWLLGLFCLWGITVIHPKLLSADEMRLTGSLLILATAVFWTATGLWTLLKSITRFMIACLFKSQALPAYLKEICRAAELMAGRKMGALIVLERKTQLLKMLHSGFVLDAEIRAELLISLFFPGSPLHDGAVIISNGRIRAAKVLLPLSAKADLPAELGTRHRAAIGISEKTDAIVLVVSEERGECSIAYQGTLVKTARVNALEQHLQSIVRGQKNPASKITALTR
jgi:uncharacterized protein (TIGR00159 family)